MKAKFFLGVIAFTFLSACHKSQPDRCVDSKTNKFKKECCNKGAKVSEYSFQGNTAYVFDPGICGADQTSEVTNDECETMGYLGGITGNTKINGEDFAKAKFVKTIWSN